MRLLLTAAVCSFLTGCDSGDRLLTTSPVTLGSEPLVLHPDPRLRTPAHINVLCIAIPEEFRADKLTLRDPSGSEVHLSATLIDTNGGSHSFSSQSFLFGRRRYV